MAQRYVRKDKQQHPRDSELTEEDLWCEDERQPRRSIPRVMFSTKDYSRRRRLIRDLLAEVAEHDWFTSTSLRLYAEWMLRALLAKEPRLRIEFASRLAKLGIGDEGEKANTSRLHRA